MSDLFNFDISKIASTLISQSALFDCSLEEAWEKYMHPILIEQTTFEEVKNYIMEKTALGIISEKN
jgi:hypothetical protein